MRITLITEPMQRTAFGYKSDYAVKVFPFFFFNETGSIRIHVEPDALEALGVGEVISFTGEAINQNSRRRLVEGRAYPADALSGRIRIVVKVGGIELIFKTTYKFLGDEAAAVDENPARMARTTLFFNGETNRVDSGSGTGIHHSDHPLVRHCVLGRDGDRRVDPIGLRGLFEPGQHGGEVEKAFGGR